MSATDRPVDRVPDRATRVLRYRNFLGVRRPSDIFLSLESGDHGDRESPCSARIATDDELDVH